MKGLELGILLRIIRVGPVLCSGVIMERDLIMEGEVRDLKMYVGLNMEGGPEPRIVEVSRRWD